MILHQKLYSRDSTDKIRIWYMEQDGSKYRTISGVKDGELVVTDWTITKQKNIGRSNETSAEQQATCEVLSKYTKQLKTGYFRSLEDIDKFTYVEPMLAKKYKDYEDKIDFKKENWLGQSKKNGSRCIATRYGLFTRKGEKYVSVPHIWEAIAPIFEKYPDAVLDGELYNYELRQKLNELISLVRKTKNVTEEDLANSKSIVQYHIYDGYNIEGLSQDVPYIKRYNELLDIVNNLNSQYITILESIPIQDSEGLTKLFQELIEDGEEGVILRNANSPYEHKRSKFLLKLKPEDDAEATIIALHRGLGNWSFGFKTATLDWNGKIFDATFKCTIEESIDILNNQDEWLNQRTTFKFFGLTGLGCPQYCQIDYNNSIPSQ